MVVQVIGWVCQLFIDAVRPEIQKYLITLN